MSKFSDWYYEGGRIPRKIKKTVLGKKMKTGVLRGLLRTVQFGHPIVTMYERREANTDLFCPHCGECGYVGSGNQTTYPEHWEYFHCLRCRKVVGYIDNSPFIHALECADYDPVF